MFTCSFWNYICDSLIESLLYSFEIDRDAFEILDIIGDGVKRTVKIEVKISDYSMFKKSFKQMRSEFQAYPCNPFYERQYRNGIITLFVKPQDEIYDIEDFNGFSDDESLEYRRDMRNYDYYWEQSKYWNERVGHAERDVEILKHSMDYSNYEEYRDAIMDQKNIVMKLKKVEKWYQDKFDEITNKYNIEPSFQ